MIERRLPKTIKKPKDVGPMKYEQKTNMGEHIFYGDKLISDNLSKDERYPLGGLFKLGNKGSLVFNFEPFFQNVLQLKGNTKAIRFMENNPGLYLVGIKSFIPGVGKILMKRYEIIAQYRKAKYVYFQTNNPRMEKLGLSLGYEFIGTDAVGNRFYFKKL